MKYLIYALLSVLLFSCGNTVDDKSNKVNLGLSLMQSANPTVHTLGSIYSDVQFPGPGSLLSDPPEGSIEFFENTPITQPDGYIVNISSMEIDIVASNGTFPLEKNIAIGINGQLGVVAHLNQFTIYQVGSTTYIEDPELDPIEDEDTEKQY